MKIAWVLTLWAVLERLDAALFGLPHSLVHSTHKYRNQNSFLPAPPGHTPSCAQNGATFCEHIGTYPRDTVQGLLKKHRHTYSLFITSETEQEFMVRQSPHYDAGGGYGPEPVFEGGYDTPSWSHLNYSHAGAGSTPSSYATTLHFSNQYPGPIRNQQITAAAMVPFLHSIWWNQERSKRSVPQKETPPPEHQIQKRQATENQLCQVNSRFVTPEAAMNNEGDWMYIVNMPDNPRYAQQVRIETCAAAGSECNGLCQVPPRHRATCRQKYTQKRLIALDGSGTTLRNGVFWIPLCCYCEIERV